MILPIWPLCATPGCERYALTEEYCRDCATERVEVPETEEIER